MSPLFRITTVTAVTALALALSVGSASAWSCRAKSRVTEGWGYSPVLQTAREEAKLQCQLNTHGRLPCRVVACTQTGPKLKFGR